MARDHFPVFALALLAAAFVALCVASASRKSVTVDELGHLPSGVYTLASGDVRHATLNPPLLNVLSALPVFALSLEQPIDPPEASDDVFDFWKTGYHFHERHRADYLRIYDAARWVPILLAVGLGLLVYRWAGELVGSVGRAVDAGMARVAGLVAASLLWFSPNWIAHARIVGTDTGTALFVAAAVFALRSMLKRPTPMTAVIFGALLGLAQLTKFYALLLYPIALVLVFAVGQWRAEAPAPRDLWLQCGVAFVASLVVLNLGYGFAEFGRPLSELKLVSTTALSLQESWIGGVWLPIPGAFVRAVDGQWLEVTSGIRSFLLGKTFQGGRIDYFVIVWWLKTSLVGIAVFVAALGSTVRKGGFDRFELAILLAFPALAFVLLSLSENRQLGLRALLSAFPFVCVWMGAALVNAMPAAKRGWMSSGVVVACLATALASFPDYLAHFNPLVGGRDTGYRHASDANVDIGQDLEGLAAYLAEVGAGEVQLFYFGSVDPALYGIEYRVPGDYHIEPGWLAVSVSLYRMSYDVYDHGGLRKVGPVDLSSLGEPEATIGGSIHVYRIPGSAG